MTQNHTTQNASPATQGQTIALTDFIHEHGITMTAKPTAKNPHMPDDPKHPMDHWHCTFQMEGNHFSLAFSTGRGLRVPHDGKLPMAFARWCHVNGFDQRQHNPKLLQARYRAYCEGRMIPKAPKTENVLDCLSSDASSIENARDFEDWCAELGFDTDSRKAEKTFKACEQQAQQLKAFLGPDAYQQLLYSVERL